MIGKLRKKFILINMVFVCSILMAVLALLCFTNYKRFGWESQKIMMDALGEGRFRPAFPVEPGQPRERRPFNVVPLCVVSLDEDGTVREVKARELDMEEGLAQALSLQALDQGRDSGYLKEYSLHYIKKETQDGIRIVFGDRGYELGAIGNLIRNCVVIFLVASVGFLILSIFFSRWALNPVERAWEQQQQFVADASHELKTPLTVILANLQILSSHRSATIDSQYKWLKNTQDEAGRMKQLVEQLLFLARTDSKGAEELGEMQTEFDFSNMVLSSILPFESVAFEQKVSMEDHIAPDIRLKGDEGQLKQLVAILMDNACKYAGEGGKVEVRVYRGPEKNRVALEVANTGEPIPKEELGNLFKRFYRTDKSRARREGGYGLGLAIAMTIVQQNRGKISVTSGKEDGTRFKVVFHSAD